MPRLDEHDVFASRFREGKRRPIDPRLRIHRGKLGNRRSIRGCGVRARLVVILVTPEGKNGEKGERCGLEEGGVRHDGS